MRERATIRFWSLYLLGASIFVVATVEAIVRGFNIAPPLPATLNVADPYLPYKPQPHGVRHIRTSEFACEYRNNSFGFRDVEHSFEKATNVFRILGLGDSFTYGIGVSFEDTYLYKLEQMLNARVGVHPRVEIIKAGIPRYFPEPERILLERYGIHYSPDLVTVAVLPNDIIDTHLGMDAVRVSRSGYLVTQEPRKLEGLLTFLHTHSHAGRSLSATLNEFRGKAAPEMRLDEIYTDDGIYERDWRTGEAEYEKMVDLATSIGARLALIYIPQQGPWGEMHSYPATRLEEWSAAHGAEFIDTLPAMKGASGSGSLYYQRDGHCRPAGNEVIATVLFRTLTERGLIP